MTKNQIFKKVPPLEEIKHITDLIGIINIDKNNEFTRNTIINNFDLICKHMDKIKEYYLECKSKIYFKNMSDKKILTVLRQCLRLYGYRIDYRDRYNSCLKKKEKVYTICNNNPFVSNNINFN